MIPHVCVCNELQRKTNIGFRICIFILIFLVGCVGIIEPHFSNIIQLWSSRFQNRTFSANIGNWPIAKWSICLTFVNRSILLWTAAFFGKDINNQIKRQIMYIIIFSITRFITVSSIYKQIRLSKEITHMLYYTTIISVTISDNHLCFT